MMFQLLLALFVLIVIAGGAIFGFLIKKKAIAAILGFILPLIFVLLFFWQIRAFVYFVIPAILCAIAGILAATENENKYVRYIQYLAAIILLAFVIYLVDSVLYLLYTT